MSKTVCIIALPDGTPHMVVKTRKDAIAYCGDNTYFTWECYSIQQITKGGQS